MGGGQSTLIELLVVVVFCSAVTGGAGRGSGVVITLLWGPWLLIFGVLVPVSLIALTLPLIVVDDDEDA